MPRRNQAWDGFLSGPENALAQASVSALARGDANAPSLLVLHGPSGVGKSRLLSALVAEALERRPGASVALLTGEDFSSACSEAQQRPEGWAELRARFRELDLLALDDFHPIARNPPAVNELMHTLDALEARGAGVAVTARVAPGQWTDFPSRLVNRFLGGLSVKVEPPGPATRRRYVLERAQTEGIAMSAEAVDLIVAAADGFRAVDGRLALLKLASQVERKPIDSELVEPAFTPESRPAPPSVEAVTRAVAARFGVTAREIRGPSRRASVVLPRHFAIALAREFTGLSHAALGTYFGKRDAKTIRHACSAAAERIADDPALAAAVEALKQGWTRRDHDSRPA